MTENNQALTDAIQCVKRGDVNAYGTIYEITETQLRSHLCSLYAYLGDDFVDEVDIRTHEFVFENIEKYNPARASFQTWMNGCARNIALKVKTERFNLRKVKTDDGRWERVATTIAMDEEALAVAAEPESNPTQALWLRHVIKQEFDVLANEGRLSMTLYDVCGLTREETAKTLGVPVIRLRRQLDRDHNRMRKGLKRRGVRPGESVPHYGRVWHEPEGTEDGWSSSQTAELPFEPDSQSDLVEKEIEEEGTEE